MSDWWRNVFASEASAVGVPTPVVVAYLDELGRALGRRGRAPSLVPTSARDARHRQQGSPSVPQVRPPGRYSWDDLIVPLPMAAPPVTVGMARNFAGHAISSAPSVARGLAHTADWLAPEMANGGGLDPFGVDAPFDPERREEIDAYYQAHPDGIARSVTQAVKPVDDFGHRVSVRAPNAAEQFTGGVGDLATPVAASFASPFVGAAAFGGQAADQTYEEARAKGATAQRANDAAAASFALNGGLGAVPGGRWAASAARRVGANAVGRVLAGALGNAATGGAMQLADNAVARATFDPHRALGADVLQSAATMAGAGVLGDAAAEWLRARRAGRQPAGAGAQPQGVAEPEPVRPVAQVTSPQTRPGQVEAAPRTTQPMAPPAERPPHAPRPREVEDRTPPPGNPAAAESPLSLDPPLPHQVPERAIETTPSASLAVPANEPAQFPRAPPGHGTRAPKRPYTVSFKTRLGLDLWGRTRAVHFNRANAALHSALLADAAFAARMESLIPGVMDSVSRKGGRRTPQGWVWHHARGGGLMELVPREQHTPGSQFWALLHAGGKGGYARWAVPRGAPPNRSRRTKSSSGSTFVLDGSG